MNNYLKIISNIGLRGATLGSKFLMIFVLARYLEPSELGLYGIFVVTVAYSMYPLGFEFYTFSSRQMVKVLPSERRTIIKNQLALHGVLYVVIFPLLMVVFCSGPLPSKYIFLFFILVVLEHLNQEAMRLLIAMQYQLIASLALFLRQGIWAIAIAVLMLVAPEYRKLESVLVAWSVGGAIAFLLAAYQIRQISVAKNSINNEVDWRWIKSGLKVAFPLFLASLSTNLISTVDRYWYQYMNGLDALGAYVFYASIAAAIATFMDAGIFSFLYPKLLANHAAKNHSDFKRNLNLMAFQVVVISALFLMISLIFSEWFFSLMDKSIYVDNVEVFYILVVAVIIQCFSYVPHFALYAIEKDKHIVVANIASVPLFVISVIILEKYSSTLAIPISLCFISLNSLLYKAFFYLMARKITKVTA